MLSWIHRFTAYYGALLAFALGALGFNLWALVAGRDRHGVARERFFQGALHRVSGILLRGLARVRLVQVEYRGFDREAPDGGVVVVANHPGMLDAVYLLARLPSALCIFKPAIRRNPLFGVVAARAGYLPGDRGLAVVRLGARQVAAGATLLVFPEGTRTPPGQTLGAFKPGFAVVARRAGAPVQLVRISVSGPLLAKGHPWWKLPPVAVRVIVAAGPRLDPRRFPATGTLVAAAEAWFRGHDPRPAGQLQAFRPGRSTSTLAV